MFISMAAIMFSNGEVVKGHTYTEIIDLARKLGVSGDRTNGFIAGSDTFVLPEEAAKIAVESGQINKEVKELTPAMLWPRFED